MNFYNKLRFLLQIVVLMSVCVSCFADSIGEAKRDFMDGSVVTFQNVSVIAVFPGSIYVEEANRSQGIRVDTSRTFDEGDIVDVSGAIETDPITGERYVAASLNYPQSTGATRAVKPLGIPIRSFIGGDFGLQKGIPGDTNLNTIGRLVTVWGPVTQFDMSAGGGSWFMLGESDDPQIKVVLPGNLKVDTDLAYVTATGICSAEKVDGSMIRVLKVRRASDIMKLQSWAENRLKTMTLEQKIGQLFQVRVSGDVLNDTIRQIVQDKHIGGIIYFQYNGNLDDPVRSAQFSNDLQTCALGPDGTGIPLLLSMDQEGGRVTRITGGADFPGNMALGAARSVDMAYTAGHVIGTEIRAVGATMDLAPVLDVNNNPANPVIGVRSFGEQPDLVSQMGLGYINGLHSAGVIATAKHFPGHGDTNVDSHSGLPIVNYDLTTLDTIHGKPFRDAVAGGLDAVMTAHIVVTCLDPNRPATLSPIVVNGYLRGNMGFDGVVMTDSMGMAGITSGYTIEQATVMAIQAGVDLLSIPPDLDRALNAVYEAVQSGEISQSRLDQSVLRILRLKRKYGLFDNPFVDPQAADDIVGNPDHWAAELSAARAAVTLVQNTDGFLPLNLPGNKKILLVTVQAAETTTDASVRFASYIAQKHSNLESIAINENPTASQRTDVKDAAASADVIIVGTSRSQLPANTGQAVLVRELLAMGKPVVVVGLREPYELTEFPDVNAYVATYNYRNCGFQAAADVIFGDLNPSGRLPVTIPGMYPFGHGLSY